MINSTNQAQDFNPCISYSDGKVYCIEIPIKKIKEVFSRNSFPKRLESVELILQPYTFDEGTIPENVFGSTKVFEILIEHSNSCCDKKIEVNVNAFQSTKGYTNKLKISKLDCTLMDLSFLLGFGKLANLVFSYIDNIQDCFPGLPLLPRLTTLTFEFCSGIKEIQQFPTLKNGLKIIKFENYQPPYEPSNFVSDDKVLNDLTVERIMDWLLLSSTNTLEDITITDMRQVTRVPHQIPQFKVLRNLWLQKNAISTIKNETFSLHVPVGILDVYGNGIRKIEPGAFHGIHNIII